MSNWYEGLSDQNIQELKDLRVRWKDRPQWAKEALIEAGKQPGTVYCVHTFKGTGTYDASDIFSFRTLDDSVVWLKCNWQVPFKFTEEERRILANNTSAFGLMPKWMQDVMNGIRNDPKLYNAEWGATLQMYTADMCSGEKWQDIKPSHKGGCSLRLTYRIDWERLA